MMNLGSDACTIELRFLSPDQYETVKDLAKLHKYTIKRSRGRAGYVECGATVTIKLHSWFASSQAMGAFVDKLAECIKRGELHITNIPEKYWGRCK